MLELAAIFRRESQRWDQTVLCECELVRDEQREPNGRTAPVEGIPPARTALVCAPCTIKTTAPEGDLIPGLTYRFYGRWREHPKYGPQFHATTFVRCQPHGRAGVIRYLCQAPHVGQVAAEKLWSKFGSDAVRILRETPEIAAAAVGRRFAPTKARAAAEWLEGELALEDCTIDLIDLLGGLGFPRDTAKRAVQEWGNRAAEMIRRNPYLLMRFRGAGFLRTDKLFLNLGGDPARLKRQAFAAWYALSTDTDGHTWHPVARADAGIRGYVSGVELTSN